MTCHAVGTYQGWSYQFVSGQVEPEASEGSQYWEAELLKMCGTYF